MEYIVMDYKITYLLLNIKSRASHIFFFSSHIWYAFPIFIYLYIIQNGLWVDFSAVLESEYQQRKG